MKGSDQTDLAPTCRVVVADDDLTSRVWLRGLVKQMGLVCAGEAVNGEEAVKVVARVKPDIVLLDVSMPVCTGPNALPEILKEHPPARVVMLTSIADEATVVECLEKGAAGYLRKDSTVDEILRVLKELRAEIETERKPGGQG